MIACTYGGKYCDGKPDLIIPKQHQTIGNIKQIYTYFYYLDLL